jgi:hypothetical protein
MKDGKPERPGKPKKHQDIFCDRCSQECLQNDKTIPGHVVVWCRDCEQQWIKGDAEKVSSKLPQEEAKRALQRIADKVDHWHSMLRYVDNDEFWEE